MEHTRKPKHGVAVAILCKTPIAGKSKTRLSPPLRPDECAEISSCFIQDIARTIDGVIAAERASGFAVYTPAGSEAALYRLLPDGFGCLLQGEGDLGARIEKAVGDFLAMGHSGAIIVNSDSPTLPPEILGEAMQAVASGDKVVLGPAIDGGYTLIGLSRVHPTLFRDMPWSTSAVYDLTVQRARAIGVPVVSLPLWYDVDDESTLRVLELDVSGEQLPFGTELAGADAPATRAFLRNRAGQVRPQAATNDPMRGAI